jgi:SAM-dependent methyltransferase
MNSAQQLAIHHWNRTPLWLDEQDRYSVYPWLSEAAEFRHHAGHSVLEIGCGTGSDLKQFASHGARAVGIDITPEHLRLAKKRVGSSAEVHFGSATNIPFPNASFDYVYSHGVLHHIDQPTRVVEEIFRVLRPAGTFNVHVYAKWSYVPVVLFLKHGRDWKNWIENSRDPVHIDLYTSRSLRKLFAPANVRIQRYECSYIPALASKIGWFMRVTGQRPD